MEQTRTSLINVPAASTDCPSKLPFRLADQENNIFSRRRAGEGKRNLRSDTLRFPHLPGLSFRPANTLQDRRRAWRLAYETYFAKGYSPAAGDGCWYGRHDARPETQTLLSERKGRAVAALTTVFDSSWGLPADEIHGPALQALRAEGRRLCELVSLVHSERGRHGAEILNQLFRIAHINARYVHGATDLAITVNPRHVFYYKQVLLFEQLGDAAPCPRVEGAPAVLMRLNLLTAAERYRRRYSHRAGEKNLYTFFFVDRFEEIQAWVRRLHGPLSYPDLLAAFHHQRRLISPQQLRVLAQRSRFRIPGTF